MRSPLSLTLALLVLVLTGVHLRAADPIFSFETLTDAAGVPDQGTRPDGFGPNGGGVTVTQDTVGATESAHSMKYSVVAGATFVGAITPLFPAQADDPNVYALVCDLTITDGGFVGPGFARIGITAFGANEAQLGPGGGQAQTTSEAETSIAFEPGTYHVTIPLMARGNPITFDVNVPFHTIFGDNPDSQMTPVAFQYYINKSNTSPITVYIDNVRVALTGDVNGNGRIDADDYALIDRGSLKTYAPDSPPGWINGDLNTDGRVDSADYLILDTAFASHGGVFSSDMLAARQSRFGDAYLSALPVAVPEPATGMLLVACGLLVGARRRMARLV